MNNNEIQIVPNPPIKKRWYDSQIFFFLCAAIPLLIIGLMLDTPLWAYLVVMLPPILTTYYLYQNEMSRTPNFVLFDENGIILQYKKKQKVCPWNSLDRIILFDGETKYQGLKRKESSLYYMGELKTAFLTYELGLLIIEKYKLATGKELDHHLWGEW